MANSRGDFANFFQGHPQSHDEDRGVGFVGSSNKAANAVEALSGVRWSLCRAVGDPKPQLDDHEIAWVPMGKDNLFALSRLSGKPVTLAKVRVALERMRKAGILAKPPKVGYMIEDRLFRDYLVTTIVTPYIHEGKLQRLSH